MHFIYFNHARVKERSKRTKYDKKKAKGLPEKNRLQAKMTTKIEWHGYTNVKSWLESKI